MPSDLSTQFWDWVDHAALRPLLWNTIFATVCIVALIGVGWGLVRQRHMDAGNRLFTNLVLALALGLSLPNVLLLPPFRTAVLGLNQAFEHSAALTTTTLSAVVTVVNISLIAGIISLMLTTVGMGNWLLYSILQRRARSSRTTPSARSAAEQGLPPASIARPSPAHEPPTAPGMSQPDERETTLTTVSFLPHIFVVRPMELYGTSSLLSNELTIGRAETSGLQIDHGEISRIHARILHQDRLVILPEGKNGTWINGQLQKSGLAAPLQDADRIGIGYALLRVSMPDLEETQYGLIPQSWRALLVPINRDDHQCDRSFPICEHSITIGRDPTCNIVLHHQSVSRHHGQISFHGDHYMLTHIGTRDTTRIGTTPVTSPVRLDHGQVISMGDVRMRFEFEDGPND